MPIQIFCMYFLFRLLREICRCINRSEQPGCIKSFANKYFGKDQAVGKSLLVGKNSMFKITGIFDKVPDNSHFHFDAFLSISTLHASK